MAAHKGSEGTVHVGTDAVAQIRSYSVEETSDTVETTSVSQPTTGVYPGLCLPRPVQPSVCVS